MVPDCQRRLERAIADLKATIVCERLEGDYFFCHSVAFVSCRKIVKNLRTLRNTKLLQNNWQQYLPHRRSSEQLCICSG